MHYAPIPFYHPYSVQYCKIVLYNCKIVYFLLYYIENIQYIVFLSRNTNK